MPETVILSPDELIALTGYRQQAAQLAELHTQGFIRARRAKSTGAVILERAHYEAVVRGEVAIAGPRLRAPTLRAA